MVVFLEESAWTFDFRNPKLNSAWAFALTNTMFIFEGPDACFPRGVSLNVWFYKPYVQLLEGPDDCFNQLERSILQTRCSIFRGSRWLFSLWNQLERLILQTFSLNVWCYKPYVRFLEGQDYGFPRGFPDKVCNRISKQIRVNRKGCQKEKRYTYGVPRFE